MNLKFLVIIIFFFISSVSYSQIDEFHYIGFEYHPSTRVSKSVEIGFSMMAISSKDSMKVTVKYGDKTLNKSVNVSFKQYISICKAIKKIKSKDLIKNFRVLFDGDETTISFQDMGRNSISYKIMGLDHSDTNTGYKDFLNATLLILDAVHVKIDDIN